MNTDVVLAVEDALKAIGWDERFTRPVFNANPNMIGATPADMLAIVIDSDGAIAWTEPVWDHGIPMVDSSYTYDVARIIESITDDSLLSGGDAHRIVAACITAVAVMVQGFPTLHDVMLLVGATVAAAWKRERDVSSV